MIIKAVSSAGFKSGKVSFGERDEGLNSNDIKYQSQKPGVKRCYVEAQLAKKAEAEMAARPKSIFEPIFDLIKRVFK